ncbi:MAG: hypothetical protein MZV64_28200 [Ignavibacteriales bacterium]|nr:hypothetical protein [Ignavibacteriales bacterium]
MKSGKSMTTSASGRSRRARSTSARCMAQARGSTRTASTRPVTLRPR